MTLTAKKLPIEGDMALPGVLHCARLTINASDCTSAAVNELFDPDTDVFVGDIRTQIATAFTASTTLTIGDSDDTDGWYTAAQIACTTAVTTGLWKSSSDAAYGGGKQYVDGNVITMTADGLTVGQINILAEYFVVPPSQ